MIFGYSQSEFAKDAGLLHAEMQHASDFTGLPSMLSATLIIMLPTSGGVTAHDVKQARRIARSSKAVGCAGVPR